MSDLAYEPWDPTGMTQEEIATTIRNRARELCGAIRERYGWVATVSDHWSGLATAIIRDTTGEIASVTGPDDQDWLLHEALKCARAARTPHQ